MATLRIFSGRHMQIALELLAINVPSRYETPMQRYDHGRVEAKWQALWEKKQTFATSSDVERPKYYVLDMFPYPSGTGLHVGHPKGYVATDVVARGRRMMGYNVLRVMGWDAFGLPTERQAVRESKHPREITDRNISTFKRQLCRLGLSYDWSREFSTSDPAYYRWTQWIFLQLYRRGLAYTAEVRVNWCPALGTVLANEEVSGGVYVETGDVVERRLMKQWMLRITDYAEQLLTGLDEVDWPESIKEQQRNWIGRSEGLEISFAIDGHSERVDVFTTRPDTLFGCTYVVLAPEHPLIERLTTKEQSVAVKEYCLAAEARSERDRISEGAMPKTGVFTGAHALNPVNGERVPIWIADYLIGSYGTGAVFACPAHDTRDYEFARRFNLPIREVVAGGKVEFGAYTGDGPHINSDFLDGLDIREATSCVRRWAEDRAVGKMVVRYRLRDWLFSRQRYWGEPIPVMELEDGTTRPVPDAHLPVLLPDLADFRPTEDGRPPLARASAWVNALDPETQFPARRETNTMPQWAGSCWYYLRFMSPHAQNSAWEADAERYWAPVDLYVGGSEHATLHLLYARFWHHVLYDLGFVTTREPFKRLVCQGMIHATSYRDQRGKYYGATEVDQRTDGLFVRGTDLPVTTRLEKMSKSRYNVVNPDEICLEYGADALRIYELFMGPLEDGIEWETSGVAGARRFLDRLWRLVIDPETGNLSGKVTDDVSEDPLLERALHRALKKVTESVENLRFNVAIAAMMTFVNEATKLGKISIRSVETFVLMLSPFAPHISEEIWERLGHAEGISSASWPAFDEAKLATETITVAVQVSGKTRGTIELPLGAEKETAMAVAAADPRIQKHLEGKSIVREIYVPNKMLNVLVK